MKTYWLNKNNSCNNGNLIVFFAGWSFDAYPFKSLGCGNSDVLFVYDYNDFGVPKEFSEFKNYNNKILITWSMGVFVAYQLRNLFNDFDYKLAINGTVMPVDDEFGIPEKVFALTLKHAEKGLAGKFYQNVFLTDNEYMLYKNSPVQRELQNRVSELENLYLLIKTTDRTYEKFYDLAIVSDFDKIIPPKNQIAGHKKSNTPVITLPYGHHIFYNFTSWNEIVQCRQTINI